MKLSRIIDVKDKNFEKIISLYEEAFPLEERRDLSQLMYLIKHKPEMHFNVIESDGELCGLFVYWKLSDFYYLEHLAVYPALRNQKIGQQVLDYVKEHLQGERLLEVEPPLEDMTTRRVNYYQRNGYVVLERDYMQPSYDGRRSGIPLWIMGNEENPDKKRLAQHILLIQHEAYIQNYDFQD